MSLGSYARVTPAGDDLVYEPGARITSYLSRWAQVQPGATYAALWRRGGELSETLTYAQLEQRTTGMARYLRDRCQLRPRERVLLLHANSIDFIVCFLACVKADLWPVPAPTADHGLSARSADRLGAVTKRCEPSAVVADAQTLARLSRTVAGVAHILQISTTDAQIPPDGPGDRGWECADDSPVMYLQCTSGTTSTPQAVMVSHEGVIRNALATLTHKPIGVSWLPHYHDLGLIGYLLFPLVTGGSTHLMTARDFLRRPLRWLELVSQVRATCTSAPNFGFDYLLRALASERTSAVDVDLSSLQFMMNTSEMVSPETQARVAEVLGGWGLRPSAVIASYGLAEATLAVAHGGVCVDQVDGQGLVADECSLQYAASCGAPIAGLEVQIVDPIRRVALPERQRGEIWVAGPTVSLGYWNDPEASSQVFEQRLDGDCESRAFMRTGDIGYIAHGELYVCGRSKDVIVLRGVKYTPTLFEDAIGDVPIVVEN